MAKVLFKQWGPFAVLLIIAILALFIPLLPNFDEGKYSGPDIAFVLIASALVFLMTPGLAFFYGGMVHRKNVISSALHSRPADGTYMGSICCAWENQVRERRQVARHRRRPA